MQNRLNANALPLLFESVNDHVGSMDQLACSNIAAATA